MCVCVRIVQTLAQIEQLNCNCIYILCSFFINFVVWQSKWRRWSSYTTTHSIRVCSMNSIVCNFFYICFNFHFHIWSIDLVAIFIHELRLIFDRNSYSLIWRLSRNYICSKNQLIALCIGLPTAVPRWNMIEYFMLCSFLAHLTRCTHIFVINQRFIC